MLKLLRILPFYRKKKKKENLALFYRCFINLEPVLKEISAWGDIIAFFDKMVYQTARTFKH